MLQIKVGIVDMTGKIDPKLMASAATALNIQVTRDLPQFWNISATVGYLPDHTAIPQGVWPVQLVASLPPGEGGFHLTKNHQPYAKVIASPASDDWTVDASHETIEMLVDPNGNRLQTSDAIAVDKGEIVSVAGTYEYLVEACDPCEADSCSYEIDGVFVSDFITPHFYEPTLPGSRYSFTGAVKAPRQILPGGYITWVNPTTDEIQQLLYLSAKPEIRNLGPASGGGLRLFVDGKTRLLVEEHRDKGTAARVQAAARAREGLRCCGEGKG